MIEIWKPIYGFEKAYSVSNIGRVKNVVSSKILKHQITGGTYLYIRLSRRKFYIHTLVIAAFVGPKPFAKAEVRHFDGNRINNNYSNLSWGTRSENSLDKIRHGKSKRLLKTSQIESIRSAHKDGQSMQKLAVAHSVSSSTIFQIIHKRIYTEI